jgi:hypothetical protein
MAKKDKGGVNPLLLTKAWKKSESRPELDHRRYSTQCYDCKTMFLGDTQEEASERKAAHNCPG